MAHIPLRLAVIAASVVSCVYSRTASAATASSTFQVTSTVQATCQVSAPNLAFGPYSGVEIDTTTTISVSCTTSTAYNVSLSAGGASGATVTSRKMTGPSSSLLGYALYRDSARSQNWGTTSGTDTVSGTGNGNAQSLTVYGALPAGQLATPGNYSDTITVTVSY